MQFKEELKVKEELSSVELGTIVETVADFIFNVNQNGAQYTPYLIGEGLKFIAVAYLIDGIVVEDGDEDIVSLSTTNPAIPALINEALAKYKDIKSYVEQVVEFRKAQYLYHSQELVQKLMHSLEMEQAMNASMKKLADQQIRLNEQSEEILAMMKPEEVAELNRRIASGEFDMNEVANMAIEKYMKTDKHDELMRQVLDEKNEKIKQLQNYRDAKGD